MIEEVDSEEIKDDDPSDESFKRLFIPDLRRPKHDCWDKDDMADFSDSDF